MKRIIVMITLLAQMVMAGTALAVPVTLDFLNAPGVDVTTTSPVTLNGVTIGYDDSGSGNGDFANVGITGIIGSTAGTLIFNFITPATALNLSYSLLAADPAVLQIADALTVLFFSGGEYLSFLSVPADFLADDATIDPTIGSHKGTLAYNGSAFDQAQMLFSLDAPIFTVDNVSYEPVPEPGTIMLLSAGLFGLAVYGRRRMES